MTNVIVQPARPQGQVLEHLQKTIYNTVPLSELLPELEDSDARKLQDICRQRNVQSIPVWGTKPNKKVQWDKIEPGDVALFCGDNRIYKRAVVIHKVHSKRLSEKLWDEDERGGYFEYVYFLDDLQDCDINRHDADAVKEAVDENHTGMPWMGLVTINQSAVTNALISKFNLYNGFSPIGIPAWADETNDDYVAPGEENTPGRGKNMVFEEGLERETKGVKKSRSVALRDAARRHFKQLEPNGELRCFSCNFSRPDGVAHEIIEMHHKQPIHESGTAGHVVDLTNLDFEAVLTPLCPTCHRIAHTSKPPLSLMELQRIMNTPPT